jgi:N-acyl-D-aspartate/D-glutamate deacylase
MLYRLSYQPARFAGLGGRGALIEGMAADIVVYFFDALWMKTEKYDLRFDFPGGDWRRYTPTEGYRWILCNGAVTHENGQPTGVTPGSFLGLRPLTGWAA